MLCFLFKIEQTNSYQLTGLIISVFGVLAIITRLDLEILVNLDFNIGDIWMIFAVVSWGVYSAFLKKLKLSFCETTWNSRRAHAPMGVRLSE